MDVDPEVEELDSFSLFLPLPYRLAILIVLGVWLWGLNLHGMHNINIVGTLKFAQFYVKKGSVKWKSGHTTSITLSESLLTRSTSPPPLRIPLCDYPHSPSRRISRPILDSYT